MAAGENMLDSQHLEESGNSPLTRAKLEKKNEITSTYRQLSSAPSGHCPAGLERSFLPSLLQVYTHAPLLDVKVSPETPVTSPTDN